MPGNNKGTKPAFAGILHLAFASVTLKKIFFYRKAHVLQIVKTFGGWVDSLAKKDPQKARSLLRLGWQAQELKFRFFPDKRLMKADQYLADLMMKMMIAPLKKKGESAMVSIFTPCEMVQEAGLNPYNTEAMSSYLTGSCAQEPFLEEAEKYGISETLCSYHKTFSGAARAGLLPKPRCIVYTTLACDANLLTFRSLADFYGVPAFCIDVPMDQDEDAVSYVASELKDLKVFLEKNTGKKIDEDSLRDRVSKSQKSIENYQEYQKARKDRYIPTNVVTPLYCGMTNNVLLGSDEVLKYTSMLLAGAKKAGPARGKRIYWMHTIPFWSEAVKEKFIFSERAQIIGCELSETCDMTFDPADPYKAMAGRLVYHCLNGSINRRIEAGIRHARQAGADAVIWFNQAGCRHTQGGALLARKKFEEAGLPFLILDGDGCDPSRGNEGQMATRLEAFLEMLENI